MLKTIEETNNYMQQFRDSRFHVFQMVHSK